jgi:Tfp pilus assembly protein PilP
MKKLVLVLAILVIATMATIGWAKKRRPGIFAPKEVVAPTVVSPEKMDFITDGRDPFKAPTEVLPTECLPSMPLCRFDFSQLKLVGVIQVGRGQFKGMVEDPDGRGYFIAPGMQIGNGTVTQVTRDGVVIHLHGIKQDARLPLNYKPE